LNSFVQYDEARIFFVNKTLKKRLTNVIFDEFDFLIAKA